MKKKQQESQYYSKEELWKNQRGLNRNYISSMEERYKDTVQADEEVGEEEEEDLELEEGVLERQEALPSVSDPRLWQVRVKRGQERQAAFQLMNKSIEFAKRGQHLSILSVTSTDKVEGYVFVEAFKDIHVKEAVKGLSSVLGGKVTQVSREEMPGIYQNEQ